MKILFTTLLLVFLAGNLYSQEKQQDSTKIEVLDEVLVKAIRVNADSPITHSNIKKEALERRNLGQDLPILLNFLPSVVTTSDAGAGVGYLAGKNDVTELCHNGITASTHLPDPRLSCNQGIEIIGNAYAESKLTIAGRALKIHPGQQATPAGISWSK